MASAMEVTVMTTLHHHTSTTQADHRGVSALGTLLVAVPLLGGVLAALAAMGGRFGGPENALTAAWYVPLAIGWVALVGAVVLLVVHRHDRWLTRLAAWSALAAGGWVLALGSAQLTGLADTDSTAGMGWQVAVFAAGVALYLLGLLGLSWTGVKSAAPPEDDFY